MTIALDAMGGDFAPKAVLEGAILANQVLGSGYKLLLVGDQDTIRSGLSDLGANPDLFEIRHAATVIEMGEHPAKAFPQKSDRLNLLVDRLLMEEIALRSVNTSELMIQLIRCLA